MMFDGRRSVTMILAVAGAVGLTAVAGPGGAMAGTRTAVAPRAAALHGTWRASRAIPGAAALNQGGYALVNSVSCSSPGNCSAGGWYTDSGGGTQAFIVSEIKGTWQTAIEVPGTFGPNKYYAQLDALSCASAGNCSAGGFYVNNNGNQAFVVNEVDGVWQKAIEVPGSAALNSGGYAELTSVSCSTPGNCTAGGLYLAGTTSYQAFVVSEVNGIWRDAVKVPGTAALNQGDAQVNSVSCGSAGNCSAGGWYTDSRGYEQLMVVNQVNGIWQNAIEVPGSAALNKGDYARITSVSCGSAGNCSAGGSYMGSSSLSAPLVVSEVNGTWQNAIEVPGMTTLTQRIFGTLTSVSCASAGNCSAGGWLTDSADLCQPLVVNEVNGTWQNAVKVPGIDTLNTGGNAAINAVSCATAGKIGRAS